MTAERCPRCDRADCTADADRWTADTLSYRHGTLLGMSPDARKVMRAAMPSLGEAKAQATVSRQDCDAHALDWRAETLRLRAELAVATRLRDEELRGYTEAQHALNLIAIAVGAESGPGAADIEGAERRRWADAVKRVQAMAAQRAREADRG